MSRDEAAEIVFLVGTLAIAAERGLSGLLKVSHLRPAQFRLLFAVHLEARRRLEGRAGRGMSEQEAKAVPLADVMRILGGLKPSSLSSALAGLPEGIIVEGSLGHDGRFKSLSLSDRGEKLAAEAILHAAGAAEELAAPLPAGERASLLRLLRACAKASFPPSSGGGR